MTDIKGKQMLNGGGKSRIEYLDLMKGFCILLMVFSHCDPQCKTMASRQFPTICTMVLVGFLPAFFFLSGLFFSRYTCFMDFLTRKTQKLLLPYLFFCIFPTILCPYFQPHPFSMGYVFNLFCIPFNGPLWFVECLFMIFLLNYGFDLLTEKCNDYLRFLIVLLVGFAVVGIFTMYGAEIKEAEKANYFLKFADRYLRLPNVLACFPFFFLSNLLRKKGLLAKSFGKLKVLAMLVLFVVVVWIFRTNVGINQFDYGKSPFHFYISSFAAIGAFWCLCYLLKRLPIISYLGRYSLVVLGVHIILMLLLLEFLPHNTYLLTLSIAVLMVPIIWIMVRVFPHFTGQKDLFAYRDGHFSFLR